MWKRDYRPLIIEITVSLKLANNMPSPVFDAHTERKCERFIDGRAITLSRRLTIAIVSQYLKISHPV